MLHFSPSPYYFWTGLRQCIVIQYPLSLTHHLQRVQNCAVRLVTCTYKREHITPVLFQLHWLPVCFRSLYKILFHTFKVLTGTAPLYPSNLIQKYIPVRMLQLESCLLLTEPKSHTAIFGEKSFRVSASWL